MSGPLAGTTVVELAAIGPLPFACMVLADLGADVIRVDRPPGRAPGGMVGALLANDTAVDRGRRSISVDLRNADGVAVVLDLAARADVLVEGFRPGVAERLGVGPQPCLERNSRLVYGRMTGWGQDGPLAHAAGHDLNYIALTGALHAMGTPGQPPTPPLNLVGDYGGGGMLLALGILAALLERASSGKGQVVDAAMVDGAAMLMSPVYAMMGKGFWQDQRGANLLDGGAPFYACYECADGRFVSVAAIEPQFYQVLLVRLCIDEPEFAAQWDRERWPLLRGRLSALFLSRTRDDWCALLEGSDACFAPVLSMSEAPGHAHLAVRGTFRQWDGVPQPAPAPRFSRSLADPAPPAPAVAADTADILARLGYDAGTIAKLIANGTVHARSGNDAA